MRYAEPMPDPDVDAALIAAYRARGLVTDAGESVHLPTACPRASACWASEDSARLPAVGSLAAALSPAYVGARFAEGRLAVVLENLRNYGGWDLGPEAKIGMRYLAGAARAGFAEGHRVLFRGGGYAGTSTWYRATTYAAHWLAAPPLASVDPSPTDLVDALDRIAILQHVKCSPLGGRSEQSASMWRECGPHVLAHELGVLQPARVVVAGLSDNAGAVRARIFPERVRVLGAETVRVGRKRLRIELEERVAPWGVVQLLFVPHPATPGGTARSLVAAAREMFAATAT